MAPSKNKPPQSPPIEKICLWTKFQPFTWLLTLSGPIFKFQPLNKQKICLWTKFQCPTWLLALSGPIFTFRPLNKLPLWMAPSKIKPPQSAQIKKYASGPSFCVLHGSWLHQVPFSHFGHKTTYPCRWRHPKLNHSSLHTLKNMPLDQVSASSMAPGSVRTHFRVSAAKQPTPIDGAI